MAYVRPSTWTPIPAFTGTQDEIYILLSGKNLKTEVKFKIKTKSNAPYTVMVGDAEEYEVDSDELFYSQLPYNTAQTLVHITAGKGDIREVVFGYVESNKIQEISGNLVEYDRVSINNPASYTKLKSFVINGISNQIDYDRFFINNISLENAYIDMSHAITAQGMYKGCTALLTVVVTDTSNLKYAGEMFMGCSSLTELPLINTSNVENMYCMASDCVKLTTIPLFVTSKVRTMQSMLSGCIELLSLPLLDTSAVNIMERICYKCEKLASVPLLNTSKVAQFNYAFAYCAALVTKPVLDTSLAEKYNHTLGMYEGTIFA